MNRRAFLKTSLGASALLAGRDLLGAAPRREVTLDDAILSRADERIDRHRKAGGAVIVRDARGKPVPGAQVRVEQTRHEFLFGSNIFLFREGEDAEWQSEYRDRFAALLNFATLGFYWNSYERIRGEPNHARSDAIISWCRQHRIACKGHPLAWDSPASTPDWLPDDPEQIRRLSLGRTYEAVRRFRGEIGTWDVVNEACHVGRVKTKTGQSAAVSGALAYVREHLLAARAADPAATLLVNDYNFDEPFHDLLKSLLDRDENLFDAIGIQSHMHRGAWPLALVWQICENFARLGLPIHFTEATVLSGAFLEREKWAATDPEGERVQAAAVEKFYTALFSHPAVEAITWWDFSDRGAWKNAPAGWLRADMSPKPVYETLMSLIKGKWWTRVAGQADRWGEFRTRAFLGEHRISVRLPNGRLATRDVNWQRGKPNRFVVIVR